MEQRGMNVHPLMMIVMVAAIAVMLTVVVMRHPGGLGSIDGMRSDGTQQLASSDAGGGGKQLYYSTMHPWIVQDHEGTCPICGMDLVLMPPEEQAVYVANHPEFA